MSNSAAVVATLGAGALGLLAFYNYQNGNENNETTPDAPSNTNFLQHQQKAQTNIEDDENSFLQQAKEEVTNHLTKASAWGSFWKDEYTSILEDRDKEEDEDEEEDEEEDKEDEEEDKEDEEDENRKLKKADSLKELYIRETPTNKNDGEKKLLATAYSQTDNIYSANDILSEKVVKNVVDTVIQSIE
jgi:hypothetical protein